MAAAFEITAFENPEHHPDCPQIGDLEALAIKGGAEPGDLARKLGVRHSVLWPVDGGTLVLDCAEDGALVIWLAVGMGALGAMLEAVRTDIPAFARANDCTCLRIEGRRGWKRLLPHWNCREADGMVILELPL
jgi:hypothetical protein